MIKKALRPFNLKAAVLVAGVRKAGEVLVESDDNALDRCLDEYWKACMKSYVSCLVCFI